MITREDKAAELAKVLDLDPETKGALAEIELDLLTKPYSLADAIREGCRVTDKTVGWGAGDQACALSAAAIAAKARGIL